MTRRALAALLALPFVARAAESSLPFPRSLPEEARAAAARKEPLVLLVSLPGCPFCEQVRRSYLLPMSREEGMHAFQIDVADARRSLIAFGGRQKHPVDLVREWKVDVTPTVLFLGPTGQEIAERLVGIAVPSFYGGYLDQRLDAARRALKPT